MLRLLHLLTTRIRYVLSGKTLDGPDPSSKIGLEREVTVRRPSTKRFTARRMQLIPYISKI